MAQPKEPKTEISKVCRRKYDAGDMDEGNIKVDVQAKFILDAVDMALTQMIRITGAGLFGISEYTITAGVKKEGFDHESDCEREPPFYMWCRVSTEVDSQRILDWNECALVGRDMKGLLPTEFI